MIDTKQDVLEANAQEGERRLEAARDGGDLERRRGGREAYGLHLTVRAHDPHQDVGLRGGEDRKSTRLNSSH